MSATRLAIVLFFAFLPTHEGQASEARAKMKAPIQPDEVPATTPDKGEEQPAVRVKSKPASATPTARTSQKKRAAVAEVPGQLSFSTFAVGGHVSEPRVNFVLDPIPLEMVDEPFALDYHQRVRDGAAKKELGL